MMLTTGTKTDWPNLCTGFGFKAARAFILTRKPQINQFKATPTKMDPQNPITAEMMPS